MARIRTIKPEFPSSEQVVSCSVTARLLFVEMWMFCDDGGRHPASVKRLKMECFPADPFTDEQMQGWVDELIASGLLATYSAGDREYWQVTGWKRHQKIDRPSYRHPGPDGKVPDSPNDLRPIDEYSSSVDPRSGSGAEAERNGAESKRPGGEKSAAGVFSNLTEADLRDNAKLAAWHKRASSRKRPVIGASEADLRFVFTAAEKALADGDNPPALFAKIVSKGLTKNARQEHEDRGRQRLLAYRRSTGPPINSSPSAAIASSLDPPPE